MWVSLGPRHNGGTRSNRDEVGSVEPGTVGILGASEQDLASDEEFEVGPFEALEVGVEGRGAGKGW